MTSKLDVDRSKADFPLPIWLHCRPDWFLFADDLRDLPNPCSLVSGGKSRWRADACLRRQGLSREVW